MPPDWTETKTTVLTLDHEMLEHASSRVTVLGSPAMATSAGCEAMVFDGVDDGFVADCNPLCGVNAFAIEMLIAPATGGPEEQRILHIEDEAGRRVLLELRMVGTEAWTLDTFLREDDANRRTLIDRTKTHPTSRWHWVALRYDGTTMQHFVDGVLEAEGVVAMKPLSAGRVSLGVRLNQVYWYKGMIREVRVHRTLLAPEDLQRR
jgi:hypothetical protein